MYSTVQTANYQEQLNPRISYGHNGSNSYSSISDDFPAHLLLGYTRCADHNGERRWNAQYCTNVLSMVAWKSMHARLRGHIENYNQFDSNQAMRTKPRVR